MDTPNLVIYNPFNMNADFECKLSNIANKFPPDGKNYGDFIFWDNQPAKWATGQSQIKLGSNSGKVGQNSYAIAIGDQAGNTGQGTNSIAIGRFAGYTNQKPNTIVLNASGFSLNPTFSDGFYVDPLRNASSSNTLFYNPITKEITYNSVAAPPNSANIEISMLAPNYLISGSEATSIATRISATQPSSTVITSVSSNCTITGSGEFSKSTNLLEITYNGSDSSDFRFDLTISGSANPASSRIILFISRLPVGSSIYTDISAPIITSFVLQPVVCSSLSCFSNLNPGDKVVVRAMNLNTSAITYSVSSYQFNITPAPF